MKKILNRNNYFVLLVLGLVFTMIPAMFITSCTHSTELPANIDSVCFDTEVLPIFQTNCALSGCHGDNAEEFSLTDYESIIKQITPLEPENSELYKAMTDSWGELMPPPPAQPLSKQQRNVIYIWIKQGANTTCGTN